MPRILTYNVHSCIGIDGELAPRRIAEVIAGSGAEIVALQELDVRRARTWGIDQAEAIALALGMEVHFHPALRVVEEAYGDAVLSTLPLTLVKAGELPSRAYGRRWEPRGALWVRVETEGGPLQVINTHLGLLPREQHAQVGCLLGPEWLGHPDCTGPTVLVGDFNAPARTATYRRLAAELRDAQRAPAVARPLATFPGRLPLMRLDHVFTRGDVAVTGASVIATPLARRASDHLPLRVDLAVGSAGTAATSAAATARPEREPQDGEAVALAEAARARPSPRSPP